MENIVKCEFHPCVTFESVVEILSVCRKTATEQDFPVRVFVLGDVLFWFN